MIADNDWAKWPCSVHKVETCSCPPTFRIRPPDGVPKPTPRPTVAGEYDHVTARIANRDALARAYDTPTTKRETETLLIYLGKHYRVPEIGLLWSSRRGRGGKRYLYTREMVRGESWTFGPDPTHRYKVPRRYRKVPLKSADGIIRMLPFVSLPNKPYTPGNGTWYGTLRVGIVLHEFCHAATHYLGQADSHGPKFCAMFDEVLALWKDGCP